MKKRGNKKRESLRLVNDYVELNKLKVVCEIALAKLEKEELRNEFMMLLETAGLLEGVFKKVFLRLKMIDLSFQILSQNLENIKEKYGKFSNFDEWLFVQLKQKFEQIKAGLIEILDVLNFNEFEKIYLLQSLNAL